jgi:hypothetical protein
MRSFAVISPSRAQALSAPLRRVAQTKAPYRTTRSFSDVRQERILDTALDCTHA